MLPTEHNDPFYASAGQHITILLGKTARYALHDATR
jgi:hypothetical protein